MSKFEKVIAIVLFLTAVTLISNHFYNSYIGKTKLAATSGGEYVEDLVGDVKYLNPVLAQNDTERSVSKLIFSSLLDIPSSDNIVNSVADHYEISPDGKQYTFYLKKEIFFSDGEKLLASDVAYTVDAIKTPELKSPLALAWSNVNVVVVDDYTIRFELPNAYGPFIYNCNFGIIPSHLSSDEFSKKLIGAGPYQFSKSVIKENKISEIYLKNNGHYYGQKPFIKDILFKLFAQKDDAQKDFEKSKNVLGLSGSDSDIGRSVDYKTSKRLGLVFNLRDEKLKDKAVRQKILDGTKFDQPLDLLLVTQDLQSQRDKANELKNRFKNQNINLNVTFDTTLQFQNTLETKKYQLILYGFDFGFDRDPYTYWHSSQMNSLNLAGYSDKNSDILLEDARMLTDNAARNAKYDQFFATLKSEYLADFYDPIDYTFTIKDQVKGFAPITGSRPYSRFEGIANWYLKEKRVKK